MGLWTRKAIESAHERAGKTLSRVGVSLPRIAQRGFFIQPFIGPAVCGVMPVWRQRKKD